MIPMPSVKGYESNASADTCTLPTILLYDSHAQFAWFAMFIVCIANVVTFPGVP